MINKTIDFGSLNKLTIRIMNLLEEKRFEELWNLLSGQSPFPRIEAYGRINKKTGRQLFELPKLQRYILTYG